MLRIRFPDQRHEPVWVVDRSFTLGSAQDNDLAIEDPSVSPQHARLQWINGVYTLHDLDSQAGTFVNGQRITQKALQNADALKIGDVTLEVFDPLVPGNESAWILVASSSWLMGQEFPIQGRSQSKEIKIGRSNHCDMIFPGTHLSREHALLTLSDQSIQVKDLGSANGTFINDVRIAEGTLYAGDEIRLDVYNFRVYGPGNRPTSAQALPLAAQETKLRAPPRQKSTLEIPEAAQPKQWKTRPTSPGNRSEMPEHGGHYSFTFKVLAAILGGALLALAIYLIVG